MFPQHSGASPVGLSHRGMIRTRVGGGQCVLVLERASPLRRTVGVRVTDAALPLPSCWICNSHSIGATCAATPYGYGARSMPYEVSNPSVSENVIGEIRRVARRSL